MQTYKFFPVHELACPCGCNGEMDSEFMNTIIIPMRKELDFSFKIPKGGAYRCKKYDGKPDGAHQGHALDILTNSRQRFQILEWLFTRNEKIKRGEITGKPVTRIGINNGSIHIDDKQSSDGKDVEVIWDYYKSHGA